MKKRFKCIILFTVIILSLVFTYPLNTYASTEQTPYININNTQSLEVGGLAFTNISFKDYSLTSTQAFGLAGIVRNNSNREINYTSTAYYYDSNYKLIAQGYNSATAISGSNSFSQMSNLSILNGHSVNEIYYYRLSIETNDNTNSSLNNTTNLTPSENYQYSSYDYVIDKYDINIVVNENNTFDITETITAYFNVPKHGIFRTIPLKNTITRLDGTTSTNHTQVTNVSVDSEYTISREKDKYKLKIGSANRTLTGEQKYIIKYTYNLGKDPIKDYDELYYNIIGNEWDTVIGNITFSITMPKEFDSSKLGFSSGTTGSTDNSKVKYNVSGNKITGSYNGILGAGEALTVRCELPEGYFVGTGLTFNLMNYIFYLFPILFLVIALLLWYKYGRDDQVVETVEFYPPQGFNSLEVGFLYKGKAENQDVTSLLIYLANQGYIKIVNDKIDLKAERINLSNTSKNRANQKITELQDKIAVEKRTNPNSQKIKYYENMLDIYKNIDKPIDYKQYGLKSTVNKLNKKNEFLIKKLKEYDGNNVNEQIFLNGLFTKRPSISIGSLFSKNVEQEPTDNTNEVTSTDLYNNFYITMNRILSNINNKENKNKIFEKSAPSKTIFIILMIIATYCLITIPPIFAYGESSSLLFALLFPGFGFTGLFKYVFGETQTIYVNGRATYSSIVTKIFGLVWGLGFGGIPWAFMVLPALKQDPVYLVGYGLGLVCVLGMVICLKYLPKRTLYGNEILGKLKGFRNFLETAEKDKLETMVIQDPAYFYNILPYAYVLGVSDKWIKKFESISLQAPSWYDSLNAFDMMTFGSFMNSTMTSAQSVMSSSPSSDSGGSSGGGSSGGGSGGGGGGSW